MNIFLIRSSEAFRTRELPRRPTVHLCSRRPFSLVSRPTVHRKPFFSKAHTPKIGILTDSNVPEGHQGLHDALYGEQGAEIHESRRYMFRKGEDEGEVMLPIDEYLTSRDGERPLGVYAVYDQQRSVQYIGFTRNVVLSLKKHRAKLGPEICAFVRAMVFMNKAMTTREILEREALDWIEREGTFPPGNGAERELWEDEDTLTINNMSEKERIEYEEQRNKFRKAMGANLHDDVPGESLESKERRLRLIKAVEGDNWSAVIDEQTNGTILKQDTTTPAGIISPFAQAPIHRSVGNSANLTDVEMDMTSVDKALDEVRPYLISDGGNVEVVNVEDGNVFLRLQGACGTCPSSTATMKMGIERVLHSTFGDQLVEVFQVDAQDTTANETSVDEHLNILRPAIEGYGGSVKVLRVADGICELEYSGPEPIGVGIRAALKDKFPDLRDVVLNNKA